MPWRCPVCGAINDDDAEFCTNCGAPRPENPERVEHVEPPALAEPRAPQEEAEAAQEAPTSREAEEAAIEEGGEEATVAREEAAGSTETPTGEEALESAALNLYIEVVNTPAHELLGKKVPLMFNVFPKITIGRSPENVIIFPDPTVSRRHAVIEKTPEGRIILRDLGSTNGTYVYNPETGGFERVEEVELRPGMLLRLGEATIIRIVAE